MNNDRTQELIIRQVCLKASVEYYASRTGEIDVADVVLNMAQIFEHWVNRTNVEIKLEDKG